MTKSRGPRPSCRGAHRQIRCLLSRHGRRLCDRWDCRQRPSRGSPRTRGRPHLRARGRRPRNRAARRGRRPLTSRRARHPGEARSRMRRTLGWPMPVSAGARPAVRPLASLALALVILPAPQALAAARPPAASDPSHRPVDARAAARPFRLNLARDVDYVRQANFVQCVGASVQMMLNIVEPGADRTQRDPAPAAGPGPRIQRPSARRPRPPGRGRVRLGGRAQPQRRRTVRRRRRGHAR